MRSQRVDSTEYAQHSKNCRLKGVAWGSSGASRFFFPEDRHHQGALLGGGQLSPALSSPLEQLRGSVRSKPGSPLSVCLHSI